MGLARLNIVDVDVVFKEDFFPANLTGEFQGDLLGTKFEGSEVWEMKFVGSEEWEMDTYMN